MNSKQFLIGCTAAATVVILASCTSSTDVIAITPKSSNDDLDASVGSSMAVEDASEYSALAVKKEANSPAPRRDRAQVIEQTIAGAVVLRSESEGDSAVRIVTPETVMAPQSQPKLFPTDPVVIAENRENYEKIETNKIVVAAHQPTSTFSIDVDSGSYANMRRFLNGGSLPPQDAVRVEELINYFSYNYSVPDISEQPFSISTELAATPWNEKTHLLHVGLKGYEIEANERPAANLVFLIDVSGSMGAPDKLGLLKPAMRMLSKSLNENDTLSIVVYAGASGVVLEPTAGNNTQAISAAISQLQTGGSTNGRAGIELAYDMAAKNFTKEGINRVILATDGDFNVGLSDVGALKKLIEKKRESGIALTTLGFGTGDYNDHLMEQLADVGNGAYAYIDTLNEARKVLSDEVTSTLLTIAKDVKIQIEFNPSIVSEYRLIGYENRHLANEDFANDKIDAGEIGAGHTVTALYEIALVGSGGERNTPTRYGNGGSDGKHTNEIAELRLRYKAPDGDKSKLVSQLVMVDDIVEDATDTADNFRFSAAVAALGQLLRDGSYMNDFDLDAVARLGLSGKGEDAFGYRQEFTNLVRLARELTILRNAENGQMEPDTRG